jgi:tetratricopeptide (TPR) repeat protein
MNSNKVQAIYMALDSHQYAKAVKLASALPHSNILGRGLLAYSFYKSGQPVNALLTIEHLLGWKHLDDDDDDEADEADIIDLLDTKPKVIDWTNPQNVIPSTPCSPAFCDETILETISITLNGMNQGEMVYKLYAWAANATSANLKLYCLQRQYAAGIIVLVRSTFNDSILASMQALVLQMARLSSKYQAWAARTALWQWQFVSTTNSPTMRLQMLPRLAESLARKVVAKDGTNIEDCLLLLEILKAQSKWTDILEILPAMTRLPETMGLEWQGQCFTKLEQWDEAQTLYIKLVELHVGQQWSCWKALIQCSLFKNGGYEEAANVARGLVEKLEQDRPARGIALVAVELALVGLTDGSTTSSELQAAMQTYAEIFSPKASCIFSDLVPYLDAFLQVAQLEEIEQLHQWANAMRLANTQEKGEDDRYKLRSLIFALSIMQKLSESLPDNATTFGPSWSEIAESWTLFPVTEGVQKENQPSDELLLLAVDRMVQQLTPTTPSTTHEYLEAATLLEMGLKQCPYNPYLKLRLIGIYQSLNASDRCWELFRDLGIKHIQVDSCTYFVLPILLEGGMYQQALVIANETLKFHNSTLADTSDFVSRALEYGTWSKADEFLRFQRTRMNHSLSFLESKGITMDCAPLMSETVGLNHGIVGGDDDVDRAVSMIEEAHNWAGAPSIVSLTPDVLELVSDNRDLSILPLGMKAESKEEIIQAALRRNLYHGILIRTTVVLEVAKGPKKGKLVKTSGVMSQRCSSLAKMLEKADDESQSKNHWMQATKSLAKAIAVVAAGLPTVEGDSVKTREERSIVLVKKATECIVAADNDFTPGIVGRLIVDHLVSVMAVMKMTAKIFHLYGWGKRKKRDSAAALATFAATLQKMMVAMKLVVIETLGEGTVDSESPHSDLLDHSLWNEVAANVQESRMATSERLWQILDDFLEELTSFQQSE